MPLGPINILIGNTNIYFKIKAEYQRNIEPISASNLFVRSVQYTFQNCIMLILDEHGVTTFGDL